MTKEEKEAVILAKQALNGHLEDGYPIIYFGRLSHMHGNGVVINRVDETTYYIRVWAKGEANGEFIEWPLDFQAEIYRHFEPMPVDNGK